MAEIITSNVSYGLFSTVLRLPISNSAICGGGFSTLRLNYILMSPFVCSKLFCKQLTSTETTLLKHNVASCNATSLCDDFMEHS